jgi:hypothetical protein
VVQSFVPSYFPSGFGKGMILNERPLAMAPSSTTGQRLYRVLGSNHQNSLAGRVGISIGGD